ncbi:MAG: exo-alpha-sialidase [Lewinellaceae bacterium]|nr:exo-alpha-sialidase [Lewinellaceae bacterium]
MQLPPGFKNVLIGETTDENPYGPCEPTICVNPKDPRQVAAGAIMHSYYWSADGGHTWENKKLTSSSGVFGDPVIIADWLGNFYYAHLSDPEGRAWGSEKLLDRIVIQKSSDGGKTYDDGSWCGLQHPKDQDKHWLCADPRTGHLLCTWTEFDKYDSKMPEDRSRILFSQSADGGKTWSEALKINQFEGDCLDDDNTTEGAVPAFGPNGEIYVTWAWEDKIWFDRSTDGGKTWLEKDITVAKQPCGWSLNIPGIQRCNGMPVLVCDLSNGPHRGTLYVNWADQRKGAQDTDIWVAKSTDGGNTWSKPIRVNNDRPGKQQFFTWMAVDQVTGYLYAVFYDRRAYDDNRTDVYLAVSRDGGQSFANQKISESPFVPNSLVFFGDYNHISAHDGVVRPIWTRLEKNALSVWTAILDFK